MNMEIPKQFGDKERYEIIKPLGSGGYADVFLAKDTKLNRHVALKILQKRWMDEPGFLQNFQNEARAAAAFNHSNILTIHDTGEFEGRIYIDSEYIAG